MKRGEKIIIERVPAGLYKVYKENGDVILIGGAASTIVSLSNMIFLTEAGEVPEYVKVA